MNVFDTAHLQCTIGEDGEPDPETCFSITVDTQFLLSKTWPMADCLISVCHDTWPRKRPLKTSAVRVSMLSFRGVDAEALEADPGLNRSLEVLRGLPNDAPDSPELPTRVKKPGAGSS